MMFGTNNRIEDPGDANKFDYDYRGNQKVIGGTGIALAYDGENRQSSYTVSNATKELYSYDGEGRRVQHQHQVYIGGSFYTTKTTVYVYDALGRLAAEYGDSTTDSTCITCYITVDAPISFRIAHHPSRTPVVNTREPEIVDPSGLVNSRQSLAPTWRNVHRHQVSDPLV